MRYRDLQIQTQREFPNNARSAGFGWLTRGGYLTRENALTALGQRAIARLQTLRGESNWMGKLGLPIVRSGAEVFFPMAGGEFDLLQCSTCGESWRAESAPFRKEVFSKDAPLPMEKVFTPECHSIEALTQFLKIPKERTAKALMFTRIADGRFVFAAVRGDMTLSEFKLKQAVGDARLATADEIARAGAAAGYASPIGLKDALVVVDDLIPRSTNLAAGANETGYHLLNTNYGRDYSADLTADLVQAKGGDLCAQCGGTLRETAAARLSDGEEVFYPQVLLALAETFHDEKGLTLPLDAAPFEIYLMHAPGKELDTLAAANDIYTRLAHAGRRVLFDDRNERAGVKFNDADLIGCPLRLTVGERGLKEGKVEVKARADGAQRMVALDQCADA
ncbi:MAG: hypothetical protein Fur002_16710 [Anaerolineales bacterium]